MRLDKKLNLWESYNLISSEQKQRILDFENNKCTFFAMSVTMLGIFTIVLGIISVVAGNWNDIPAFCKIIIDILLLCGAALGIFYAQQRNKVIWFEGALVGFFMLCGASIGLIGQVFQTNGSFSEGGLFWCLITLPLLIISNRKILPVLWIALLLYSIVNTVYFEDLLEKVLGWHLFYRFPESCLFFFVLVGGVLAVFFAKLNHIIQPKSQVFKVAVFYAYMFIYATAIAFMFLAFMENNRFFINTCIELIILFMIMALIGVRTNQSRLINGNISGLYMVFLMIYFRVLGSLMNTGIGLIISGLVIIGGLKLTRKVISTIKAIKEKGENNAEV